MTDLFEAAGLTPEAPRPWPTGCGRRAWTRWWARTICWGRTGRSGGWPTAHRLSSMILWGPPGTGKTTIARLLAKAAGYEFQQLSAVFSGVADLKKAFETARGRRAAGQATLLFVDEIHRFNRAQQDGFLPFVEEGDRHPGRRDHREPVVRAERRAAVALPGLSCCKRLDDAALETLLAKAEAFEGRALPLDARGARGADRHGRRRRPLSADPGRDPVQHRPGASRSTTARAGPGAAEAQPGLRQGPRGALQPHLRPA